MSIYISLIFAKAFTLFLTLDPLGNTSLVMPLVKPYSLKKQKFILRRESLIALFVLLAFYFVGAVFLNALGISQAAVQITGGFVLFIFALNLLFPDDSPIKIAQKGQEPFIVPIAVPLIAGPSSLATTILYAHQSEDMTLDVLSILLGWGGCAFFIVSAPFFMKVLGEVGLKVCERLMGIVCLLIGVQMFLGGVRTFLES